MLVFGNIDKHQYINSNTIMNVKSAKITVFWLIKRGKMINFRTDKFFNASSFDLTVIYTWKCKSTDFGMS